MSSSFSLCFYFENAEEYNEWVAELVYIQRIYTPYIVFQTDTENNDEVEKNRKRSEDFEIL